MQTFTSKKFTQLATALCALVAVGCGGPPLPGELLYANDFEDGGAEGDEYLGLGSGPRAVDVQIQADFFPTHKPRTTVYEDGTRGVRMSTATESLSGFDHSLFRPLVVATGALLTETQLRFSWTLRLPASFDHTVRPAAYEDRSLFVVNAGDADGVEVEAFSMRFIDNQTLGFFFADVADEVVIALPEVLIGGSEHQAEIELDFQTGAIVATFDGVGHDTLAFATIPVPLRLIVTPAGNSLNSDTDTALFASLAGVEIHRGGSAE